MRVLDLRAERYQLHARILVSNHAAFKAGMHRDQLHGEVTAYLDTAVPSRRLPATSWSEAVAE